VTVIVIGMIIILASFVMMGQAGYRYHQGDRGVQGHQAHHQAHQQGRLYALVCG
jgi:hypothetical protein